MIPRTFQIGLLFLLLTPAPLASAQSETPFPPVPREERVAHISSVLEIKDFIMDLSVLDVRPHEHYLEGHIPTSFPLSVEELERAVLASPTPNSKAVVKSLDRLPITARKRVLVYDATLPERNDGYATWLLAYAGVPLVEIMDGGFSAWIRRQGLGIYMGYPMPLGARGLRPSDLRPRTELRVDPADVAEAVRAGGVLLDIMPAGPVVPPPPGVTAIRLHELMDPSGAFLFPYHLGELLKARDIDPGSRLLLQGSPADAGLAWIAFTGNGFRAAVVTPILADRAGAEADAPDAAQSNRDQPGAEPGP